MKAFELKKKYVEFFKSKNHKEIKNASLIPENDPTVLFTTAGMHPLVPYLLGQTHSSGKRLVNVQRCIRTGDIEDVGDEYHLTFFEMLGNWSLGDYFKKEAIEYSFEFLTSKKWLNIPVEKLAVTVFKGDKDASKDEESANIWLNLGIPKERIAFLGKEDNWWGPAGKTGPCGPDTEMFVWIEKEKPPKKFDSKNKKWVEIWNDVFMQYEKTSDGKFVELKEKNVDTGMGVERTSAMLQGKENVYDTELFLPLLAVIRKLAKIKNLRSERIIADHIRSSVFLLMDGAVPSNLEQGYVLRRLIRNSIRHGRLLGIENDFTIAIADEVIANYKNDYPSLLEKKNIILEELSKEEIKFKKTLSVGLRQFEKLVKNKKITGKDSFILFTTYGFPLEMTEELAKEHHIKINKKEFEKEFKKHQELSRAGMQGRFASGLADQSEQATKLHTATHLLHAALRKVLGNHVQQKGSNITQERLRFDFSHDKKLTDEELKKVENLVNEQIKKGLLVKREEMSPEPAKKSGALGFFEHKYGEKISVYSVGDFSKEICTGPHVKNTKEIGRFKIIKEEAVASGIRRIKAVIENG